MRKKIIIFIISIITINSYSQDQLLSQSDLNMMFMNPAYAGFYDETRILVHDREQWVRINGQPFNTSYACLMKSKFFLLLNHN